MNLERNYGGMKLDIQTTDVKTNDYLEQKIHNLIKKLQIFRPDINWMDIYLKSNDDIARPRTVVVRLGIPGGDFHATDTGERWKMILKNVEKRLIRQIEKRRGLLLKMAS